ncbi:SDR family oxidoreductase [Achromobacter xylosoxidans]|jgi:NAD(P)-dependent dehydrogenase (short-subunit alcohol dehydrogenase family)|uniref:SDR family oxidoreductase n=2 Tax=Pseudomonadota TaxID=1224 RepID=A0A9W5AFF2_ALCXX|nr:SDR family oxidoreductase [Achromobacter xylosoxidans]AMH06846.1 KR domain-containing protein [Achromobacter xylosoxidans]KOQ19659.1 short-chain dehydrogenase [Achromobacter xylosoxidans]KOQ19702.1 short-chain dehydrogenase [Achromobacter xylosoxidans]KOQ32837.1 short-chain dehydrogenase [Achromobacter xylosoxidans]KOQ36770.1 short-chain dehydrogenase [Achromobacter xylosoxidans]
MELKNATVLITGANRGIGLAFAREALARGARKVYAGARDPASISLPGLQAIKLDVTSDEDVAAAAALAKDVTLVINNAGIAATGGFLADDSIESARRHLETNLLGPLRVAQAFAPVLAANGGGALLNVLSIASWINRPLLGVYGMSKSAAWALTNGLRHELREQGTQVLGLHMGFVDTDLTRGLDAPKSTPESVVRQAFDALEAGAEEVLADDATRQVKQGLAAEPPVYLQA